MAAMAWLASRGVVIKGGIALERLAAVTSLAFDKTGTLTEGRLSLGEVRVLASLPGLALESVHSDVAENELLRLAAAAEQRSEHLLAQLIVREADKRNLVVPGVEHFTSHPGAGVTAQLSKTSVAADEAPRAEGSHTVVVGNRRHLQSAGVALDQSVEETLAEFDASGHTPLLVALNGRLLGVLGVRDTIRPEAHAVLDELKHLGISEIALLTGDRRSTAEAVAKAVGFIDHVEAELLPAEKADWVTRQQRHGAKVGMIGDGVNDAPALASADVGLALGGVGSDIAAEAGDLVLMGDPLAPLPGLVRLSRQTVRVIRQNIIVFAFIVNGTAVLLAAWGFLSPVGAAVFHQVGSLAVLLNAMRLLWFERWHETWVGRRLAGVAAVADSLAETLSPNRGIGWMLDHWRSTVRALVAAAVVGLIGWNVTVLAPDEEAVVTRFGRFHAQLEPGLHWRLPPPLERVYREKTRRVQNLEIGYRATGRPATGAGSREPVARLNPDPIEWDDTHLDGSYERREDEALVFTGDEQLVELTAVVQYRISDLRRYLFDADRPAETFRAIAESALRAVCSEQSLAGILTSARPAIEAEVRDRIQQRARAYRLGLEVVSVGLNDVHPPLAVVGDYRDVASALEDRQRLINDAEADYLQEVLLAAGEQAVKSLSALRSRAADGDLALTDEVWRALEPELSGTAKADLLDAERDRLGRVERAAGEADRFSRRLSAYRVAPWVTHVRMYWEAVEQGLAGRRKIIVDPEAAGRRQLLFADPALADRNLLGVQPPPPAAPEEEH
jgi:Cu+-exporting ATPase